MVTGEVKLPLAFDNWAIKELVFAKAQGVVKFTLMGDPAHNAVADTDVRLITSLLMVVVMMLEVAGLVPVTEHKLDVITHLTASELKI